MRFSSSNPYIPKLTGFRFAISDSSNTPDSEDTLYQCYNAPEEWNRDLFQYRHIFSFGVLLIYMFGEGEKQPFSEQDDISRYFVKRAKNGCELKCDMLETIQDANIRKLAAQCISIKPEKRGTARDVQQRMLDFNSYLTQTTLPNEPSEIVIQDGLPDGMRFV